MGRASALLAPRGAAFVALAAGLVAYYLVVGDLWHATRWWDIAWIDVVLIPAVFLLVWLALPARRSRLLLPAAVGCGALAWLLVATDFGIAANFAKLAATTLFAWWFLGFFETVGWVVMVAAIVPFVDAWSVWRGPTNHIVNHEQHVFSALSFAFPVPGGNAGANLGLPDLLFFALFLAAAARFRLRPFWTWLAMTISLGATMTLAVAFDLGGLPALPGLSLGFLLANGDVLWRRRRTA